MNDDDGLGLNYEVVVVIDYVMDHVYCHPGPQQPLQPHHTAQDQGHGGDHAQQVHGDQFVQGDEGLLVVIQGGHYTGVHSCQGWVVN